MTHTPGPWILDLMATLDDRPDQGAIIMGADGLSVARVMGGTAYGHRSGLDGDANARLIAEAPNLLAALIRLREWVRNPGEDDSAENEAVIYQAEAAIARAEGGTP